MPQKSKFSHMASRFRGFLPIVVDIETSGLNPATDALLEIALVTLDMNNQRVLSPSQTFAYHVEPFIGAHMNPDALAITGIDPSYPLRFAIPEMQVLHRLSQHIWQELEKTGCKRAVIVGHNAWFDLAFLQAAIKRCQFKRAPIHTFTTFDTATLSAVALGETVLAKAAKAARIPFDVNQAHSAIYDAERTAELFCYIVNRFNGSLRSTS